MAMAMPSNTARAGGVFLPVIKSLSEEAGSTPEHKPQRLGRFLAMSQCHGAAQHSSNLFVTGAAQNLMCLKLAEEAAELDEAPGDAVLEDELLQGGDQEVGLAAADRTPEDHALVLLVD